MPLYSLRQATQKDFEFLFQLHAASMREYVEATWGWDETWQKEYFTQKFDPERHQIIQIENKDTGVIAIEQREDELFIALIEIHPTYQGRGVGTALLQHTINKAHNINLPATLHVLKANTPARRLYERLGFVVTQEQDVKFIMACHPSV